MIAITVQSSAKFEVKEMKISHDGKFYLFTLKEGSKHTLHIIPLDARKFDFEAFKKNCPRSPKDHVVLLASASDSADYSAYACFVNVKIVKSGDGSKKPGNLYKLYLEAFFPKRENPLAVEAQKSGQEPKAPQTKKEKPQPAVATASSSPAAQPAPRPEKTAQSVAAPKPSPTAPLPLPVLRPKSDKAKAASAEAAPAAEKSKEASSPSALPSQKPSGEYSFGSTLLKVNILDALSRNVPAARNFAVYLGVFTAGFLVRTMMKR